LKGLPVYKYLFLHLLIVIFPFIAHSKIESIIKPLRYCIPVDKIDLNPFRKIIDGKDLAYLMLLKSYISEDPDEPGILEKFEFSPNGNTFTGQLNKNLTWSDNSPVTATEAAMGIARGLYFRSLGARVKVKGTAKILETNWLKNKYSGIEILNDKTFRLHFESTIDNLNGTLREAISTNSRHNRLWPIKLDESQNLAEPNVLGKFPMDWVSGQARLKVENTEVILVNGNDCHKASFSAYPEALNALLADYQTHKSINPQSIYLTTNTARLKLNQRRALANWLRYIFQNLPEIKGINVTPSFFLVGESGYIHQIWKERLQSLNFENFGIKLLSFTSGSEFKNFLQAQDNDNDNQQNLQSIKTMQTIFLIDYELLNQNKTGLDLIEELNLGGNNGSSTNQAILVTSRYEEDHIRSRCAKLKVKLIPKGMAGFVPIEIEKPKIKYDAILIDDDDLIHLTWQMLAKEKNKNIKLFKTEAEFLTAAAEIDPDTSIYVDVHLANSVNGVEVARRLHELGFFSLHLATGYTEIEKPDFIKTLAGKDPPI